MPFPRCSANWPKRSRLIRGPGVAASTATAIGVDVGAAGACARRTARPARTIRTVEIAPVAQGRERSRPERIIDTFSESGQAGAPAGASKAALVGKPGAAYALSVDDVNRGRDAAIAAP